LHPRVVDENVDRADRFLNARHSAANGIYAGDIEAGHRDVVPGPPHTHRCRIQLVAVAPIENYRSPVLGQSLRDRKSNALR
jgi:hypothetical protein